jgi:hypothetical protein
MEDVVGFAIVVMASIVGFALGLLVGWVACE